ncbi:uncharacterized protein LOC122277611 isoform X3 [Carya illinoinensis]|uniref:uncharacterized protein LOC122277611 isoform X3 n=1 Tax=Carya illinoinensis TaxID=32201 RepID=UPI001C72664B|nr:uncharacterized protein LOC122277611 isoform X3 [Carya illinoinensis]
MEYSSYKEVQVSGEQRVCRNESEYVQDSTQDFFTNEFGLPLTTIPKKDHLNGCLASGAPTMKNLKRWEGLHLRGIG